MIFISKQHFFRFSTVQYLGYFLHIFSFSTSLQNFLFGSGTILRRPRLAEGRTPLRKQKQVSVLKANLSSQH